MNGKHAYIIIYVYIDNIQVFWVYRESEWPGERKINICNVLETTIVPQMVIHRLCSYSLCLSLVVHYLQTSLTVQRANSKNARFPFGSAAAILEACSLHSYTELLGERAGEPLQNVKTETHFTNLWKLVLVICIYCSC